VGRRATSSTPEQARATGYEVRAGATEYLDAVVAETLRLQPVLSLVARRLTKPVEIGGWALPAGGTVTPAIYLLHRRSDLYRESERFLPERFLDEASGTYTWIPFGGGVRHCLGSSFAQAEMRAVLSELVKNRALRPTRPESEPTLRRAITGTPRYDAEVALA
jgi:cytochrome P450 family 135